MNLWTNRELEILHEELEQVREALPRSMATARGCLYTALKQIELADDYVAKFHREEI